MSRMRPSVLPAAAGVAAMLTLVACGESPETASAGAEASSADSATSSQPSEITVTHAQGETTVPVDPETVVVYDIGVLSTLDTLGIDAAGVPDATFPDGLEEYASDDVPKVGSLFEPDLEAVNALDPDLIVVAGRSAEALPALQDVAPTIDLSVDNENFLESFRERTETVGEIFGEEDAVEERLAALDEEIADVKAQAADAGTGLIVLTTGGEVSAYGAGSRFGGLIHDTLGVTPADPNVSNATHGDSISFEYIAETNPDHLYVIDRDAAIGEAGQSAEQVLDNELVGGTTAWKNGDVTYLDPTTWYIAPNGLPSVEEMVSEIGDSLA